ncbi:hypothetical protein COHA_004555 [Chlorella ohadii]|uniref:Protein kinase domain-containing protein n=1 Tax=Chlorella ohadii TaxID=2649997 RepID=A0AAD5DSI4_9CHLO|nr:hypothetical protein COHA_004555 [Chlorella ohadii]
MAKKRAQRKAPPPAPAAAQGGVAKRKMAARQQAGQQKRRQQQAEGAQAAAPATAGGGKAALGAQAQTAAKAPPTKKQRKAQAWRKRLVQRLQQQRAAKAATARKKPAAAKPPVPRRPASGARKPGTASGQAVQQQQQPAGARKKAGNRKQQPKQQPAAATPASKRKQLGKRKQQTAAAGTKPPAAAAAPGKRKREQLEAGTHYFCLDTNVLLQQAQLGVRAAWLAIAASPDSPVQLLVPLKVLQELKHTANNWRHKARFAAQGALALLGAAMPCHARCRVQREDEVFRRHPLPLVNQRGDDAVLDCLQHFAALGAQVTLVTLDQAFRQRAVELGLHCLEPQRLLAAVRGALGAVPAASASADIGSSAANGSSSGLSSSRSIESGDASSDSGAAASSDSATTTSSSSAGGTSGSATSSDSGTSGRSSSGSGSATESCTEDEAAFGCIGRVVRCAPGAAAAGTPRLAKLLGPQLAAAETCPLGGACDTVYRLPGSASARGATEARSMTIKLASRSVLAALLAAHLVLHCVAGADAPASNAYIWGAIFPDETSVTYKPVPVPGDLPLVAGEVQMATNWACGLAANGSAWCIGTTYSAVPEVVNGSATYSQLATSKWSGYVCGIRADDQTLECWGSQTAAEDEQSPEAANFMLVSSPTPTAVMPDYKFTSIALGIRHICGVEAGTERVLSNAWGQLGRGDVSTNLTETMEPAYIDVPADVKFESVGACNVHTVAVARSGEIYCFGENVVGQCGNPDVQDPIVAKPTVIPGSTRFTQVSVGGKHICAVDVDSELWCWGDNSSGELGCNKDCPTVVNVTDADGYSLKASFEPVKVEVGQQRWNQVSAAIYYTCATTVEGAAYCWGKGYLGDATLGRGTNTVPTEAVNYLTPYAVAGGHNFSSVAGGYSSVIGVLAGDPAAAPAPGTAPADQSVALLALVLAAIVYRRRRKQRLPAGPEKAGSSKGPSTESEECAVSLHHHSSGAAPIEDELLSHIHSVLTSRGPLSSWAVSLPLQRGSSSGSSLPLPAGMQDWEVQWGQIDMQRFLGRGSWGRVYQAKWSNMTVAAKVLVDVQRDFQLELPEPIMQQLYKEAVLMSKIRHLNVVSFLGICCVPPCILTEYCSKGSLYDIIAEASQSAEAAAALTWPRRITILLDSAAGLGYLHSRAILHRDIKSPNVLVDDQWRGKLADFNLSTILNQQTSSTPLATNPTWLAPELLEGHPASVQSDIYALGLIMAELLNWQLPFTEERRAGATPFRIASLIRRGARPAVPLPGCLPGPHQLDEGSLQAYCELMRECWANDPADRPSLEEVIERLQQLLNDLPQ